MGFFKNLFKRRSSNEDLDNSNLFKLLEIYKEKKGEEDSYKNVVLELMNGNSFLLFPTENDPNSKNDEWQTAKKGITLKLESVVILDGLKVLGAFTDETALTKWTNKPTQYTAMSSKDVLQFAKNEGIDRIVINSDQPNMFVLERNKENISEHNIEEDTKVQLGTPNRPLKKSVVERLISFAKKNETVAEIYQYGQMNKDEYSLVIGFKLTSNSDNAKQAAVNIVQNSLENEIIDQPFDLFFIEDEGWHSTIKKIEDSLIYKQ